MTVHYARYELEKGFIHNWIVAGPLAMPVLDLDQYRGNDYKLQIARHYYDANLGLPQAPVEAETIQLGETNLMWNYFHCDDDHFVDCTAFYHTCHYLKTWACSHVMSPSAQTVTCILTTNGPADVWVNGTRVHRQEHFHHQIPHSVSFQTKLVEGRNEIIVRFEEVAVRECPYVMALQIVDAPAQSFIFIPTLHEGIARRETVEKAIEAAFLDRDAYVWDDEITVHWSPELAQSAEISVRLQKPDGWIYAEGQPTAKPDLHHGMGMPLQIPEGQFQIFLFPTPREYYEGNLRLERRIALTSMKTKFSDTPYSTLQERSAEALLDAAKREVNVFSEIAKMALGYWQDVNVNVIQQTIDGINQRKDCSDFYLVGLLGMMYRYGDDDHFPESLKQPLEECVLNFKYWMDEPGEDAMCYWSENHQILFHACELLAGQLYPDRTFTNAKQKGQWHKEKGERLAMAWLQKRGAGGFREWDSNCYFEEDLLALSHIADLAENESVYNMTAVIMDKMFLTMAINSYKGIFGSTHGRAYTEHIKGARGESTTGVSRLMWGMGTFNHKILATVSLACMENYTFPLIIGDIANDLPQEMWNRERHAGKLVMECDTEDGTWEVNKVTYKTPDYMLCSAQDYHPGEPGYQQHIWQATMSPDAVVFVTHPSCISEENSHRPGFWHGNVTLPRVAQWKDVLIAVHKIPDTDWMGFTHAYFPAWAFDERALIKGTSGVWAFARKGDGYLAITAARGLEFMERGDNAFRELRSYGKENSWICHMGRAALDGDFKSFQDKILALDVKFNGLSVRCNTLRGETLEFGWQGDLKRNGKVEPITGFKHYDNPYCVAELNSSQLEVVLGEQGMRLNFAE
jgi:hypothetical protein